MKTVFLNYTYFVYTKNHPGSQENITGTPQQKPIFYFLISST